MKIKFIIYIIPRNLGYIAFLIYQIGKILNQPGTTICDASEKSTIFLVEENQQISEFNTLQKINSWFFEGEKMVIDNFISKYIY